MNGYDKQTTTVIRIIEDIFIVDTIYRHENQLTLNLRCRYERSKSLSIIEERLKTAGYTYELTEQDGFVILSLNPKADFKIPKLNIILFFITLFSVYIVPVFYKQYIFFVTFRLEQFMQAHNIPFDIEFSFWEELKFNFMMIPDVTSLTLEALSHGAGLMFTLAMISILFCHEMGHFISSRRRDIITSWPYFIPAPNIIGTFGAIIKSKSPFWNRNDLIHVGAWGPIAGWVVALFFLIFGLTQSTILPADQLLPFEGFSLSGESLLMKFLTLQILGAVPEGFFYRLSEAAFAGWVGLLVTSINMLPIGQLDGGHVLYGLTKKTQHILGYIALAGLLFLGFQSNIWWFFAVFGIVFGVKHPPTLNDHKQLDRNSTMIAIVAIIILVVSFTPVPFE